MAKEINSSNYDETVSKNDITIIDFFAPWCGPCRMFGPIFEKVSENHPDVTFVKCNTMDAPDLAAKFGVRSIPTIAVLLKGELIMAQPGAMPEAAFDSFVTSLKTELLAA